MENQPKPDNAWTDARLAALDPDPAWRPDSARAFAALRARRVRRTRRNWICGLAAAAAVPLLFTLAEPRACANPRGCAEQSTAPRATHAKPPIACEVFSDYQCPHCALFHQVTLPLLVSGYVKTGKMSIVYRDYPLPQHPYARLAAKFANAAAAIGKREPVADRLFRTQDAWGATGDIAGSLAGTLTPAELKTVERDVQSDPRLDASIARDLADVEKYEIHATPTLVVFANGKRQNISPIPAFPLLQSYLNSLLGK